MESGENVIKTINEEIQKMQDLEKDGVVEELRNLYQTRILPQHAPDPANPDHLFLQLLTLYTFFLKENQIGPSVYSLYAEEEKCPVDRYGELPPSFLDPISTKNKVL